MSKRIFFSKGSGDLKIGTKFKQSVRWKDATLVTDNPVVLAYAERDRAKGGGVVVDIVDLEPAPVAVLAPAEPVVPHGAGEADALTGRIQCSRCAESFMADEYAAHARSHGRTKAKAH